MFEWSLVSIILVSWNNRVDLQRCLLSLMAQRYPSKPLESNTRPRLRSTSLLGEAIASGYALQRGASTLMAKAKTKMQAFGSAVSHLADVRSDHESSQIHAK